MTAVISIIFLVLIAASLLNLVRIGIRETLRAPRVNAIQHRFYRDSRERANWQMFTCALSAGTLTQLQENLK
jgi:hypothetical protein